MNKTLVLAAVSTLTLSLNSVVPVAVASVCCAAGDEQCEEKVAADSIKLSGLDFMKCKMVPDVETWQPSLCDIELNLDCIFDGTFGKEINLALSLTSSGLQEVISLPVQVQDSLGEPITSRSTFILTVEEKSIIEGDGVPFSAGAGYVYSFWLTDLKKGIDGDFEVENAIRKGQKRSVASDFDFNVEAVGGEMLKLPLQIFEAGAEVIQDTNCGAVCATATEVYPAAIFAAGAAIIGYLVVVDDKLVFFKESEMRRVGDDVVTSFPLVESGDPLWMLDCSMDIDPVLRRSVIEQTALAEDFRSADWEFFSTTGSYYQVDDLLLAGLLEQQTDENNGKTSYEKRGEIGKESGWWWLRSEVEYGQVIYPGIIDDQGWITHREDGRTTEFSTIFNGVEFEFVTIFRRVEKFFRQIRIEVVNVNDNNPHFSAAKARAQLGVHDYGITRVYNIEN
jgi:hypothetical protein